MLANALRHLAPLGRTAGAMAELSKLSLATSNSEARAFAAAAAPKQSLDQYVENLRSEIADAYEDLVRKHDAYKQKFAALVSTSGVPSTSDFSAVVDWTNKTTAIFKEVSYPDKVWQLSAEKVKAIQEQLQAIPAEKAAFAKAKSDDPAPWFLSLTDAQIAEMKKNPRIYREMEKLHGYEEKLKTQIQKDAKDRGVPALSLKDLPVKVDLESEHAFSAQETKWCIDSAKAKAADMLKNDPMLKDPYNSAQFKELLKKNAEKFGIPAANIEAVWQKEGKTLGYV